MRYALVLCLLSASLMKLTKGQASCDYAACTSTYTTAFGAAGTDTSKLCKAVQDFANCFLSACKTNVPPALLDSLNTALKSVGGSCVLPNLTPDSGSRALCASLLTVLGGLVLAAYKTFRL